MKDKFFLDTNIFVYSFDPQIRKKQQKAQKLIKQALSTNNGVVSFQVVQEFINVATRKFAQPLSRPDCEKYLEHVFSPLCKVLPNISFYRMALECMNTWKYSWYDSLIISASRKSGCKILYSEDLQHGQDLQGLKIINPFL